MTLTVAKTSDLDKVEPEQLDTDTKFYRLKTGAGGVYAGFRIDKLKFIEYLYAMGFRRLDVDKAHIFIRVYNHRIVKEVTQTVIVDELIETLKAEIRDKVLGETSGGNIYIDDLISSIFNSLASLFNVELLYRLKPREAIEFSIDEKDHKYIYFKNGFIDITKDRAQLREYSELTKFIWESELLKRDYKEPKAGTPSYFEKFINLICNNDTKRTKSLRTIIGYNLHSFSNTKLRATVLTDSRISDDNEPNGRTGKTLFCKGLGQILSPDPDNNAISTFCEINGKDFDPRNKNKYQQASIDTRIIVLNDVRRNFDIEVLFNDITEGVTVERKNQHPFRIRPKILLTTNKTIRIEGDSSKDRFIEFEFGEYFHKGHSPEQEFKHWFFRDWDSDEWNRFYDFMVRCVKEYLYAGLVEPQQINLNTRKLREGTSLEFVEWIESHSIQRDIEIAAAGNNGINKHTWFDQFLMDYPDFKNSKLTRAKFSRWVSYWCKYSSSGYSVKDKVSDEGREYIFYKAKA